MTLLTEPTQTERTVAIVCDRCAARLEAGTAEFDAVTQIEHRCGYQSVWEDGEEIRADLCELCLKQLIDGFALKKCAVTDSRKNHCKWTSASDEEPRDSALGGQQDRAVDEGAALRPEARRPGRLKGQIDLKPDWDSFFDGEPTTADFMSDRTRFVEQSLDYQSAPLAWRIPAAINFAFDAHARLANSADDAVRFWDRETPYAVHPTWCAMTLLQETVLERALQMNGALALLWHDLLEDTQAVLPESTAPEVKSWVEQMSFGSFSEERAQLFDKSPEIRLLKLYDKTSNLMDSSWMSEAKRKGYAEFTLTLADDVEAHFGALNIVKLARALAEPLAGDGYNHD